MVPKSSIQLVIQSLHEEQSGIDTIRKEARKLYYWKNMTQYLEKEISTQMSKMQIKTHTRFVYLKYNLVYSNIPKTKPQIYDFSNIWHRGHK